VFLLIGCLFYLKFTVESGNGRMLLRVCIDSPTAGVCVLQCVAVCCSVLQCVDIISRCHSLYLNVLQCVVLSCSVLQGVAVCVAVRCIALPYFAMCCNVLHFVALWCTLLHCNTVHCSVFQSVAAHCSVLQRVIA